MATFCAMGIWTSLRRWDERVYADRSRAPRTLVNAPDSPFVPAEEVQTTRLWHALHVALTGEEQGGEPPASYVVWTSRTGLGAGFHYAHFVHPSDLVREIAGWLRTVDFDQAVGDLYAAIELGAHVYSFESGSSGGDMVQVKALRKVFKRVSHIYAGAAAAGHLVEVLRG